MIDFRYHIVSLISVFLALAVGIALGAGPLKETIEESLTGQVARLRSEKEALRAEATAARQALNDERAFIDQAAADLLTDRLLNRQVAVVVLGEVPAETLEAIEARLTQAGASVTGQATLTEAWTDPSQRSFRTGIAGTLADYIAGSGQTETTEQVLAAAVIYGLVNADATDPGRLSTSASAVLGILTSGSSDNPLVRLDGDITVPADSVIVVAPPRSPSGTAASPPPDDVQGALLAVAVAAQAGSAGAVLVDGARGSGSLVEVLLADRSLQGTVTTVSGMDSMSAPVVVPMALAAQIAGHVGHYGFGSDKTVLPPTVTLPEADD